MHCRDNGYADDDDPATCPVNAVSVLLAPITLWITSGKEAETEEGERQKKHGRAQKVERGNGVHRAERNAQCRKPAQGGCEIVNRRIGAIPEEEEGDGEEHTDEPIPHSSVVVGADRRLHANPDNEPADHQDNGQEESQSADNRAHAPIGILRSLLLVGGRFGTVDGLKKLSA